MESPAALTSSSFRFHTLLMSDSVASLPLHASSIPACHVLLSPKSLLPYHPCTVYLFCSVNLGGCVQSQISVQLCLFPRQAAKNVVTLPVSRSRRTLRLLALLYAAPLCFFVLLSNSAYIQQITPLTMKTKKKQQKKTSYTTNAFCFVLIERLVIRFAWKVFASDEQMQTTLEGYSRN